MNCLLVQSINNSIISIYIYLYYLVYRFIDHLSLDFGFQEIFFEQKTKNVY